MSNLIDDAEKAIATAAAPNLIWIKLAGAAALALGLVAAGWWLHGKFDGTKVAQTETKVAVCQAARDGDNAVANGAAAQDLAATIAGARAADAETITKLNARIAAYAAAQKEADHVPVNPNPAVSIDPEPLRQLFIGLRDADRAGTIDAHRGDTSGDAQH